MRDKKILIVAHIDAHIQAFHIPIMKMLKEENNQVYVAANGNNTFGYCDYKYSLPFQRNPVHYKNLIALVKLIKIMNMEKFDIIHCHTPSGGAVARIANRLSRFYNTKMIYTAHGFHFFKGNSRIKNVIYRTIEKKLAKYTDILITINQEDYEAARKFRLKKMGFVAYVPGVGVDDKYYEDIHLKDNYKNEMGISDSDFVILSVGELNNNKNHELVIRSIYAINDSRIHYIIAGIGPNKDKYLNLIKQLNMEKQVHILGFRKDIREIHEISNLFVFPSLREGLGLAGLESLACGNAVIGMNTRGATEYVIDGETGYLIENNIDSCKNAIIKYMNLEQKEKDVMSLKCKKMSQKFSLEKVQKNMKKIYMKGLE